MQHSQRRRWIWVQKGDSWFNCDPYYRYPWSKRKWLASFVWVHRGLRIHLSFHTGQSSVMILIIGWEISYSSPYNIAYKCSTCVRYFTFWGSKVQKSQILASIYATYIIEYILRMQLLEPVQWALWQSLLSWLIHWRYCYFSAPHPHCSESALQLSTSLNSLNFF